MEGKTLLQLGHFSSLFEIALRCAFLRHFFELRCFLSCSGPLTVVPQRSQTVWDFAKETILGSGVESRLMTGVGKLRLMTGGVKLSGGGVGRRRGMVGKTSKK